MAELLLVVESLVFAAGFKYIFSRDRLFGLFFFFLFLYAVPAQIGYYYFSDLSALTVGYFGEAVWYSATVFIILSLASFWTLFALFRRSFVSLIPLSVRVTPAKHKKKLFAELATLMIAILLLYQLVYLAIDYSDISWFSAQDEAYVAARPTFFIFILVEKLFVAMSIVQYAIVRQHSAVIFQRAQVLLLVLLLCVFVAVSFQLGNRTDLLAFILGVVVFESSQAKFTVVRLSKAAALTLFAFACLTVLGQLRARGAGAELDLTGLLLLQDYYAPAHILFAAMANNFVHPLEVIVSNTSNALILLKHPFLQNPITDIFRPDVATRSSGYAFYVFTEGFVFLGISGFIYNGVILVIGMSLWRKLAMTGSHRFNALLLGLMGSMAANLVRGQTAYFIKYLYMYVAPGALLYAALTGVVLRIQFRAGAGIVRSPPYDGPTNSVATSPQMTAASGESLAASGHVH